MTSESLFELFGLFGTALAIYCFLRSGRHQLMPNIQKALVYEDIDVVWF